MGRRWTPVEFKVTSDRIRDYADVIDDPNPLYRDADAARAAGFPDVVAPPMFAVVYSFPALEAAVLDTALDIDLGALLHGAQEFQWDATVHAGDTVTTTVTLHSYKRRLWFDIYEFEAVSENQRGERTARAIWQHVIRLENVGKRGGRAAVRAANQTKEARIS